ncbi:MAG: photosystem II reaction center PsbP family protein [Synergistaceae bacterium]|jgi:hypothetical protein|nr:photosystem II reaction center PsbP family protein [Synergistaceae bacterium]
MLQGCSKRSVRSFLLLAAFAVAAVMLIQSESAADQSFKAKNGLSFNYPDGWTALENHRGPITNISIFNRLQPTITIAITVSEGSIPPGSALPDEEATKAALASSGQDVKLLSFKKITVAGHDAALAEYSTETGGMYIQTRSVSIIDGTNLFAVTSIFMDKSKVADGQKISEIIEKSLSLK